MMKNDNEQNIQMIEESTNQPFKSELPQTDLKYNSPSQSETQQTTFRYNPPSQDDVPTDSPSGT